MTTATRDTLDASIARAAADAVRVRHALHRIPETSYQEFETAKLIRGELDRLGIAYVAGVERAPTATIATIGDPSRPCVALRADIDALPIQEATGVEYASARPGFMHACGHDGHSAMLLAAASVLSERSLPVCAKLIWQPAEEGGAGAQRLVEAGVLDGRLGPKVEAIYGLHGWPGLPVGVVATKGGALLAASDTFQVVLRGRGCHGAFPHLGRDPIAALGELIGSLQHVVSREIDPTEPAVVTVGIVQAGTATNIIPDVATLEGTLRTFDRGVRARAIEAIRRRAAGVAAAHGCEADVMVHDGYPALFNDPDRADFVRQVVTDTIGPAAFLPAARPAMGGEDFAFYAQAVPACFAFLGVTPPGVPTSPPLHSDRYDFNDAAIGPGVRLLVGLVMAS